MLFPILHARESVCAGLGGSRAIAEKAPVSINNNNVHFITMVSIKRHFTNTGLGMQCF